MRRPCVPFGILLLLAGSAYAADHRVPDEGKVAKLREALPTKPWIIQPAKARELAKAVGDTPDELLIDLMPIAQDLAVPPISNYRVGEAGRAASGTIYLGVNVEFPGHPLFQTIHAEQFVLAAMLRGMENGVEAIAMPAAPCGHCRQFMWEVFDAAKLRIVNPKRPETQTLAQLLPSPVRARRFGRQRRASRLSARPIALSGSAAGGVEKFGGCRG